MAITSQQKLNTLKKFQRTDGSVQAKYDTVSNEYQKEKRKYKLSKTNYDIALNELYCAKENLSQAPLTQKIKAYKSVKKAKLKLKQARAQYQLDKEQYKQKLKEFRALKKEIKEQYKNHKNYAKFFLRVKEAQKAGIQLPDDILNEYNKQKQEYLSSSYSYSQNAPNSYLSAPNTKYSKDVYNLIWQKRKENIAKKLNDLNTITKAFSPRENER